MDLNFINSLIAKSSANLEKALAETERIRTEIENDAKLDEIHIRAIEIIRSWAEPLEVALLETKRSFTSALMARLSSTATTTWTSISVLPLSSILGKLYKQPRCFMLCLSIDLILLS